MDNKIFINTDIVDAKITKLRGYKEDMKTRLINIHNDIKDLPNIWSGRVGDDNYEILDKYANNFEVIIKQIEDYINFLEKAKEAYKTMDSEIIKKANDSSLISILEN